MVSLERQLDEAFFAWRSVDEGANITSELAGPFNTHSAPTAGMLFSQLPLPVALLVNVLVPPRLKTK